MPKVTTTIVEHDQRSGNNKKGRWTLNIFSGGDGEKYQTFDKALSSKLFGALESGDAVEIVYENEERGDFTNKVVQDVEEASGAAVVEAKQKEVEISKAQADKDLRINRWAGLERAIMIFHGANEDPLAKFDELLELSDQLVAYANGGREAVGVVTD